jgi:plastocyanin
MNKSTKVLVGIIIILIIAIVYLLNTRGVSNKQASNNQETPQVVVKEDFMKAHIPAPLTDTQKAELKAGSENHQPTSLTFNVTGGSFYFTPNEIKVKQGDKVKIIFTNAGGMHNLMFNDFGGIGTKTIQIGESDTIEFTAKNKGTFEFYCAVGNGYHRMMGQIGVLIVE